MQRSAEAHEEKVRGSVYKLRLLLTQSHPALRRHQSKLMTVLEQRSDEHSEMNRLRIQPNKESWHAYRSRKWEF